MNVRPSTVLVLLVMTFASLLSSAPRASDPTPEEAKVPTGYDEARDPAKDLDLAAASAHRDGKRILLFIGGDWCGWCHQMATFFASNDDLREMLHDDFEVVKVAVDRAGKGRTEFLDQFPPLPSFPFILVLDTDRTLVCMYAGADMADYDKGTYDRDKMCGFLTRWARVHPGGSPKARGKAAK